MPSHTFYGEEIRGDIRDTRVTQIYNILSREIRSGRWEANSRFPSVTELSSESGLSRGSIQKVLNRLDADGLIATENRRGSYVTPQKVASGEVRRTAGDVPLAYRNRTPAEPDNKPVPSPSGYEPDSDAAPKETAEGELFESPSHLSTRKPQTTAGQLVGRIGIALIRSDQRIGPSARQIENTMLLEALLEVFTASGLKSSISFFDGSPDWEVLAADDAAFPDPVDGIIAISSGGFTDLTEYGDGRRPVVFIAGAESTSMPSVTRDHTLGAFRVTRDLISAGHNRIIALPASAVAAEEEAAFLNGYRAAMARVGLPVDEEAILIGHNLPAGDIASLRDYLQHFHEATAIFCGNAQRATELITLCDALGVTVPNDLTIAAAGTAPMRGDRSGDRVTGFDFPAQHLAKSALTLLEEILKTGTCTHSQVRLAPRIVSGDSAGPPRRGSKESRS